MRLSRLLCQTLRTSPADAVLPGYRHLLRAGLIRPLAPGHYSFLPLGVKSRDRVSQMLGHVLCAAGGQEVALPHPARPEVFAAMPDVADLAPEQRSAPPADAGLASLLLTARGVIQSYRQLPVLLYQFQTGAYTPDRAPAGLFNAREGQWADVYSLYADEQDGVACYARQQTIIARFLDRCGVQAIVSVAGEGPAGAAVAHKWVYPLPAGPDIFLACARCGYTALIEAARWRKEASQSEGLLGLSEVETPDCKTIADLAGFLRIPEACTAKAVFLVATTMAGSGQFVLAMVRGDRDLSEGKLRRVLGVERIEPATEAEIRAAGAEPGYGSPVGLQGVTVVVDDLAASSPNLVAGANRPGYHLLNVNHPRDYTATIVADIARARDGDACPGCGSPMSVTWPETIAPYQIYLMTAGKITPEVMSTADGLYGELQRAGVDVLYDDRDERAGVKFNDADLIGLPVRVAVGERGLKDGVVELKRRTGGEVEPVAADQLVARVVQLLN